MKEEWYNDIQWGLLDEQKTELVFKSAIEAGMIVDKHIISVNQKASILLGLIPVFIGLSLQVFQIFPNLIVSIILVIGEVIAFTAVFPCLKTIQGKPIFTPYRRSYDLLQGSLYTKSYLRMIHGWLPGMDKETLKDHALLNKKNRYFNWGIKLFLTGASIIILGIIVGVIIRI